MNKLTFIALMALILIACVPVQANTITMANPGGIAERDIIVYNANGTMYGYYNSTSVITLSDGDSYIFSMKPMQTNPLEDPADWLETNAFPFVKTNFIPLLALVILLAILVRRFA